MIYLYLFGTCFHFIYVFMIIGNNKKVIREDYLSEVPNEAVEFDWSYYKIVLPVPNHEMEYNENMVQNPEYELH